LIDAALIQNDDRKFAKFKAEKNTLVEWFDFHKIKPPLLVRPRRAGDRFVPLGLNEKKKVGKFLTAARVPQQLRQKLLIVADSEKIIWLWPVRTSGQAKVAGDTRKILQLRITDMPKT
jgi:tRNA(Ile)-lysidine synthase